MKNNKISVFKDLFKSTDVPFDLTLEEIVTRIKTGTSKEKIDLIRKGNKEVKKKLPSIIFSGEYSERNRKGLKKHSGLMVLDFDKYPSNKTLNEHLELLKTNKHFVLLFISPSGNGIKGVVRVPNTLDEITHPQYFKAFQKKFKYEYFDVSNSNVDRVCFESYDPNIYINYEAELFETKIVDEGFTYFSKAPVIKLESEDRIISRIMKFDWQKAFVEGQMNNYVFDLAGAFCEYGVPQSMAENFIMNNIVAGNCKDEKAKLSSIKSAYSSRQPNSKYFEDYDKINRVKSDLKNGKDFIIKTHKIDEKTYDKLKEEKELPQFWFLDKKGSVKIHPYKYKLFLEGQGFNKYFPKGSLKPTWVHIKSNIVRETSVELIKDFVLKYLLEKQEYDVWELCVSYYLLFNENHLLMLDSIELKMLKDEKNKSFIVYENGILTVTKDDMKLVGFMDVDGYVWESQILKRKFVQHKNYKNDYQTFISNISNTNPKALECVIGYLISTYKNKMNNKAIILNDEVISDNPEGGTGKGVLIQGVKRIRKTSILDGKSFDDKKGFPYQTVSLDSQILVWDDVKAGFNFESKFSLVTEGITIERKNKDAIKLSVEESPKIVISTNYVIKGDGNSHDRRRHEIEIAQYYGNKLTPYDEFGKQLFDDWNIEEFEKFDNYMVFCLQQYLNLGLIAHEAKNLKQRKIIAQTSKDFIDWIEDDNLIFNDRIYKADFFQKFTNENQDYNNKIFKRNTFNRWIQKYCGYKGYDFEQKSSNGVKWFMVNNPNIIIKENELDEIPF
jgi:hypothetical protein